MRGLHYSITRARPRSRSERSYRTYPIQIDYHGEVSHQYRNIRDGEIVLHPRFPETVWVVVEQVPEVPYRFAYDAVKRVFCRTDRSSLIHLRGFSGLYGWIGGTGSPPGPHFDVLLFTDERPRLGDILPGHICGMYRRADGDHKFVAVAPAQRHKMAGADLQHLDECQREELTGFYAHPRDSEAWLGGDVARRYLSANEPTHG